ncbi:uncharacterized protein MEPE_04316 [Melanopsichium pennsylvanicum]|uniref:Uncharacterized protein n=1 Tax=Melanopsichium pennsylvanicum TaxID=63383 RepID=A0AAJ5C697_9BASI|nr:uncharacterized protein MEPE_04316 [Melanopsichium pennsylvanicum]
MSWKRGQFEEDERGASRVVLFNNPVSLQRYAWAFRRVFGLSGSQALFCFARLILRPKRELRGEGMGPIPNPVGKQECHDSACESSFEPPSLFSLPFPSLVSFSLTFPSLHCASEQ